MKWTFQMHIRVKPENEESKGTIIIILALQTKEA
jgi:hypothetical protein